MGVTPLSLGYQEKKKDEIQDTLNSMFNTLKDFNEMMSSRILEDQKIEYPDSNVPDRPRKAVANIGETRAAATKSRHEDAKFSRMSKQAESFLISQSTNKTSLADAARLNDKMAQRSTMSATASASVS
jgi:hypothetical protein